LLTLILVVLGLIHIAPGFGMLGSHILTGLYGISADEVNLQILMRHRAVLFAILGGFIFYSIWRPELRIVSLVLALISTVSFCVLCWLIGSYNEQLQKVMWIDVVAAIGALAGLSLARSMTVSSR